MKLNKHVAKNILSLIKFSATVFISYLMVHFLLNEQLDNTGKLVYSVVFGLIIFYYIGKVKWFDKNDKHKKVAKPSYMYYNGPPTDKEIKKRETIIGKLTKDKGNEDL